jgi:hypothetical protein
VTEGVARLTVAAAGPRRLRAELWRATNPLRRAAGAPRRLSRVGRAFPGSLLGAELAEVMGERLQRALRFWEGEPAALEDEVRPRGSPSAATALSRTTRTAMPRGNETASDRRGSVSGTPPDEPRKRQTTSSAMKALERLARRVERVSDERSRLGVPVTQERASGNGATSRALSAVSPVTMRRQALASAPLTKVLHTYWETQRVVPLAGDSREAGPALPGANARHRHGGASERLPAALQRPLPLGEGAETAGVPRFVPEPAPLTSPRPRTDLLAGPQGEVSVVDNRLAWLRGSMPTDWLTGDLADQMADVLRDQAVRHGVDLT